MSVSIVTSPPAADLASPRSATLAAGPPHKQDDDPFTSTLRTVGADILSRPGTTTASEPVAVDNSDLFPISSAQLCRDNPAMKPVVIDGILRESETVNVIAASKVGKTHLAIDLALSVATGRAFLDTFAVTQGLVLYIDCELHKNTLAKRIGDVAAARGIPVTEYGQRLDVIPLRGKRRNLETLAPLFNAIEPGHYRLIVLDALYRLLPRDCDENSNADITGLYNLLDRYAEQSGAAFVVVHHASKGNQSEKSVTDIGSGAGAQSRAADAHVILRPHAQDDAVVMEAACRSFAPLTPVCLRWTYPVWNPASDLDPADLRKAGRRTTTDKAVAAPAWTLESFVNRFITDKPTLKAAIVVRAGAAVPKLSERQASNLLDAGVEAGLIHRWTYATKAPQRFANVPQGVPT